MKTASARWFFFLLLVTAAWQFVYCAVMTRGEFTGLFYTGQSQPLPPGLPRPGFVYPNSSGYDAEMYRLIARDPLSRKGYWACLDDPRYRARRIFIPGLAAILGLGSPSAVDLWFVILTDLCLAFGGICFLSLAPPHCPPWLAAALYLAIPAVVASSDRLVLDGPFLAGFLAVWLLWRDRRMVPLSLLLAILPLIRESGICVTAGVALLLARAGKYGLAAAAAATTAPALAWWSFVAARTAPSTAAAHLLSVPLWPQFVRLFHPFVRGLPQSLDILMASLDELACLCLWIAFLWLAGTLWKQWRQGRVADDVWLVLPIALLAAVTNGPPVMAQGYDFMRTASPLLAWAALRMLPVAPRYAALYLPASSAVLMIYRAAPLLRLLGR